MSNPEIDIYADIVDTFTQPDQVDEQSSNQVAPIDNESLPVQNQQRTVAVVQTTKLSPSYQSPSGRLSQLSPIETTPLSSSQLANNKQHAVSVYVGNLTWWTKDTELMKACESIGVKDVVDIKFFENRTNGQSKGIASVTVETDESYRKLLSSLPSIELNGQKPHVTPANRHSLNQLDPTIGASSSQTRPPFQSRSSVYSPPSFSSPSTSSNRFRHTPPIPNPSPLSIAALAAALRPQTQQANELLTNALSVIRPALNKPSLNSVPQHSNRDDASYERNMALAKSAKKRADGHVERREYQNAIDTINQAISLIAKSPHKDERMSAIVSDLRKTLNDISDKRLHNSSRASRQRDHRRSPPARYPRYSSPGRRSRRDDNHGKRRRSRSSSNEHRRRTSSSQDRSAEKRPRRSKRSDYESSRSRTDDKNHESSPRRRQKSEQDKNGGNRDDSRYRRA